MRTLLIYLCNNLPGSHLIIHDPVDMLSIGDQIALTSKNTVCVNKEIQIDVVDKRKPIIQVEVVWLRALSLCLYQQIKPETER